MASSFFGTMVKTQKRAEQSIDVMGKIKTLDFILPNYIESAINVNWTSSPIVNIGTSNGEIRTYRSRDRNNLRAPITMGLFLREAGFPNNVNRGSDLRATAIYFQEPTSLTSGKLLVATTNPGRGSATLSSNQAVFEMDGIVDFEFSEVGFSTGAAVRLLQARIVFRKFISTKQNEWRWCRDLTRSNCSVGTQFVDIEHTINIPLVNNIFTSNLLNTSGTGSVNKILLGNFYMYRMVQKGVSQ
ncbi:MAG: hypothetical protein HRT44_13335 [Bdellovibrionales bacterium]|nr:hypothetical protein [Bdellovibrionales bacterium]NQZ20221.1 hypothetical protein [Bdellovibrionales bacterium]